MSEKFGMEGPISDARLAPAGEEEITYAQALRDGLHEAMLASDSVFVVGEGVNDSGRIFGTTASLLETFGSRRVIESPLSENGMTGICVGAALAGLRPVMIHQRIDFALLAADQIINHAAKWAYMYDGKVSVPFVIRCIVGKGWGQAAQHSQSLHALFAHIPGLKVVMPATPEDAKGMLMSSIADNNPVLFIESRSLHATKGKVAKGALYTPLHQAKVRRTGRDCTLIGVSYQVPMLLDLAESMKGHLDCEVIDLRSVSPLDNATIMASCLKTKKAAIVDIGHRSFGIGAEVSARIHEHCFGALEQPVLRIGLPHVPTPCGPSLERAFYPDLDSVREQVLRHFAKHRENTLAL